MATFLGVFCNHLKGFLGPFMCSTFFRAVFICTIQFLRSGYDQHHLFKGVHLIHLQLRCTWSLIQAFSGKSVDQHSAACTKVPSTLFLIFQKNQDRQYQLRSIRSFVADFFHKSNRMEKSELLSVHFDRKNYCLQEFRLWNFI